ncbi:hypothetical protein [Dokdonella ginsengisoli]|uniref:Uncharacterized protein n=1 Tax=Dokdonella ginsengisoli TaxID=363846 RepID=A0ABV9QX69_9GAMM
MISKSYGNLMLVSLMLISGQAIGGSYLYQNCADQSRGVPLVDCSSAEIDSELRSVRVNHYLEAGLPISNTKHTRYLGSEIIPVAIPDGYNSLNSWSFKNRKYIKIKSGVDSRVIKEKVDIIVVLDYIDEHEKEPSDLASLDDPRAKPIFSFWYSTNRGVLAIGIPKPGDSGDVYYCVSSKCLFGP